MSDELVTYPQDTRHPAGFNAADEVQSVAITGGPTGGTFTLTFTDPAGKARTTAGIAFSATAAAVQTALEALDNVPVGSIIATGGALPGAAVTLTFGDAFADEDIPQLTGDGTGLTGGTSPAVVVTTTTAGTTGQYDVQIPSGNANADGRLATQHRTDAAPNISGH